MNIQDQRTGRDTGSSPAPVDGGSGYLRVRDKINGELVHGPAAESDAEGKVAGNLVHGVAEGKIARSRGVSWTRNKVSLGIMLRMWKARAERSCEVDPS